MSTNIERGPETPKKMENYEIELGRVKWLETEIGSESTVKMGVLQVGENKVGEKTEILICKRISKDAENVFYKHLIFSLFDEYHLIKGEYTASHISKPIGFSKNEKCYYYILAPGYEGFSWEYLTGDNLRKPRELEEWNKFVELFKNIGVKMYEDIYDPEEYPSEISKNIILEGSSIENIRQSKLSKNWKRIDFGEKSISVDKERLWNFIESNKEDLKKHLGEKFNLLFLTAKKLKEGLTKEEEERMMEELLFRYQKEILKKPESEK